MSKPLPDDLMPQPEDPARLLKGDDRMVNVADHVANFLQCVKTRQRPASELETQHRAATACHLANIAFRTGRRIRWDPEKEQILDDDQANAMQKREQRAPYQFTG